MLSPDSKVSPVESSTTARISAGYHKYPGHGPGKVEEEVCILDSGAASRRQGNRERPLGREQSAPSAERMGQEPTAGREGGRYNEHEELAHPFFYHVSPDVLPYGWEPYGIYERSDTEVLGVDATLSHSTEAESLSRCFNCGDLDHKATECRFRLNRELISLSRQYYQFYQGSSAAWKRIHSVEAWRQQRLDWLEEFEPGKIKGDLLKEALMHEYASEEEWLKNISVWGYPLGWVSKIDPREKVKERIWNENEGDIEGDLDDCAAFKIHGDGNAVETISFQHAFRAVPNGQNPIGSSSTTGRSRSNSVRELSNPDLPVLGDPIRWAHYPLSYFSSQHLILYTPPIPQEPWSSNIFKNTDAYLYQFHHFPVPPPPPPYAPPPLPPSSPPPPPPNHPPSPNSSPPSPPPPPSGGLPLSPNFISPSPPQPPLLPTIKHEENQVQLLNQIGSNNNDDLSEADMDLSDSD